MDATRPDTPPTPVTGSGKLSRTSCELTGTVRRVVFSDRDSGAHVLAVVLPSTAERIARGRAEEGEIVEGCAYTFLGRWEHHAKHGEQFAWQTFTRNVPAGRNGMVKYLSDVAPHVGRVTAERLFDRFGPDAEIILRTDPGRVAGAGLMSREHAEEAAAALQHESAFANTKIALFDLFAGRGFPAKLLIRAALEKWGARAAATIRRNPYAILVADLPGAGFKRCDKLYCDLGYPRDTLKRQMLCAWNFLHSDTSGHTWFPAVDAARAIREAVASRKLDEKRALRLGIRAGWLAKRKDAEGKLWVAEADNAKNEWVVSEKVKDLLAWPSVAWPTDFPADLPLSDHQRAAILVTLSRPVGILNGSPGTGKTFSAAAVIRQAVARHGRDAVAVCAPTGKAAVRLTSTMHGYGLSLEAKTIHRLLGVGRSGRDGKGWAFLHNAGNPLPVRFLFVDETSMLDADLAANLLSACAPGTHVFLIGDTGQLPPVGHGAPLRDLIAAGVPCGTLSEIRRNAGMIVEACARIKAARPFETCERYDPAAGQNLRIVSAATGAAAAEELLRLVRAVKAGDKFDPVWELQVLVAVNAKSDVSRSALNRLLQAELNPTGRQAPGCPFRVGDKVICLKNGWVPVVEMDWDGKPDEASSYGLVREPGSTELREAFVANGEIGKVVAVGDRAAVIRLDAPDRLTKINMMGAKAGAAGGSGEDGATDGGGADGGESAGSGCDFSLAYACTVHKYQGSEVPVAVIMVDDRAGFVACREWAYTAISRASKLCILVGRRGVLDRQCARVSLTRRKTFLVELLRDGVREGAGGE